MFIKIAAKLLKYSGLLAIVIFVSSVIISAYFNSWFSIFDNAFSELGGSKANMPYIFNYGLIFFGFFMLLFSVFAIIISNNKVETISGSFMIIASFYFMLIGVFPYDFNPIWAHVFSAFSSFLIAYLSVIIWGIGSIIGGAKKVGLILVIISILSPFAVAFFSFYSAAIVESYGIFVLTVWIIFITFYQSR
ncbi:MAG: DUF998 domain-containing protein [Nitrososphaeria archaeon]|nr:DUF998 domain-containing protein [Nitrososphaeria archaeon]